jgi:hypothetical protein
MLLKIRLWVFAGNIWVFLIMRENMLKLYFVIEFIRTLAGLRSFYAWSILPNIFWFVRVLIVHVFRGAGGLFVFTIIFTFDICGASCIGGVVLIFLRIDFKLELL